MSSISWSFGHSATFRAALAFLLQRNGWTGKFYSIASLVDTMNTICGYKDATDDMKKTMKRVDEEMIKTALQVNGKNDGEENTLKLLIFKYTSTA
jgi:hypothetical protein